MWDVETIRSHRKKNGRIKYLIRWAGFGPEKDTWEPEAHVLGCDSLLSYWKGKGSKFKAEVQRVEAQEAHTEAIGGDDGKLTATGGARGKGSAKRKWIGQPTCLGAQGERYYNAVRLDDLTIEVGNTVVVASEEGEGRWVCLVQQLWEDDDTAGCFLGAWYYLPEETASGRLRGHDRREVFETVHADEQELATIDGHARVLSWAEYQVWLNEDDDADDADDADAVFVCRARYHPGTGEFLPLSGAASLTEAARLGGGGSSGSGTGWALHSRGRMLSKFAEAAACLTPRAAPERMPCREKERAEVLSALRAALVEDGSGSSLYLSGTPGTGKTATVHHALRELATEPALPAFRTIEINGMKLSSPQQVYTLLWEAISGMHVSPTRAMQCLERRFCESQPKGKRKSKMATVLLLDELDYLVTRTQSVIYNLFEWATSSASGMLIIGISNTMDLPERLLPRVHSRVGIHRINFFPYTHADIAAIIKDRLTNLDAFNASGIELCARKVASISGDVRRALETCRLAAQLAEREALEGGASPPEHVTIEHFDKANKQLRGSVVVRAVTELPMHQLLLLASVSLVSSSTGRAEVDTESLSAHHRGVCLQHHCIQPLSTSELSEAISRLRAARLLGGSSGSIRLLVTAEDVKQAAQSQTYMSHIFERLPL